MRVTGLRPQVRFLTAEQGQLSVLGNGFEWLRVVRALRLEIEALAQALKQGNSTGASLECAGCSVRERKRDVWQQLYARSGFLAPRVPGCVTCATYQRAS